MSRSGDDARGHRRRGDRGDRGEPTSGQRQDNGLTAPAFVPLTDVEPEVGAHVLHALGRARIAAYLADARPVTDAPDAPERRRLFVASDERVDARTIVAAAIRGLGTGHGVADASDDDASDDDARHDDPDDPERTRSAFDALVADWHVDTIAAVREAERDLAREDADWRARLAKPSAGDEVWLDEDHYVPPVPPPLPRLAGPTILAMTVLAVSIVLLGIGGEFGLASSFTLLLGVCGILLGVGILFTRIREHHHDDGDDGAAI